MIYADNAATTPLDRDAFEAMCPFLLENYGNASQPYSFSVAGKKALKQARKTIAHRIGALPEEIYFTSGGTESDNWAIKGIMAGSHGSMITSQIEHHAVLHACNAVERLGVRVEYLPADRNCVVQPEALKERITQNTRLVSVMMANNEVGSVQPIAELSRIAHENGALFHTDAVQAVGHMETDVNCLEIDMLSASAHKFNGPKGIGFLYIRKGTAIQPYADGGAQEAGLRAGTENVASIVAMAVALEKNCEHMQENQIRLRKLEQIMEDRLRAENIDFIRNGNRGIPGNISLSIRGAEGEMLLHRLDLKKIYVSTGSACDSKNTEISHVIKAMKVPDEYAEGTIRVSFGAGNTEEDAADIARALAEIMNGMK